MRHLVLIGGGEHARVIAETVRAAGSYHLHGYVDPNVCPAIEALGVPRLGDDAALAAHPDAVLLLAFGSVGPSDRRALAAGTLAAEGREFATVIHPHASVSPSAVIGDGTVIFAGAVVQTGARVGAHCVVNSGAVVEHDVQLADHVQLAPGAVIGGGASIGAGTFIGLRAGVRDHVRVGARTTVGMGAAVVQDLPDGVLAVGVPARIVPRHQPVLREPWP